LSFLVWCYILFIDLFLYKWNSAFHFSLHIKFTSQINLQGFFLVMLVVGTWLLQIIGQIFMIRVLTLKCQNLIHLLIQHDKAHQNLLNVVHQYSICVYHVVKASGSWDHLYKVLALNMSLMQRLFLKNGNKVLTYIFLSILYETITTFNQVIKDKDFFNNDHYLTSPI